MLAYPCLALCAPPAGGSQPASIPARCCTRTRLTHCSEASWLAHECSTAHTCSSLSSTAQTPAAPSAVLPLLLVLGQAPERFVELDPAMAQTLLDQKDSGKALLLITNSDYEYTDQMMSYAYNRFLPEGSTWRDLFDMVRGARAHGACATAGG